MASSVSHNAKEDKAWSLFKKTLFNSRPARLQSRAGIGEFQRRVYAVDKLCQRELPWRKRRTPYRVLVSELMLQQTQAGRVVPKYRAFLKDLGSFKALAKADTSEVIKLWQGLGYNRRALALKRTAEIVHSSYSGRLPRDYEALLALPGIGDYTAKAVRIYAYNFDDVLIETNIRSLFTYCFFPECSAVSDADLLPLIASAVDRKDPARWYDALMDLGVLVKANVPRIVQRNKAHRAQSQFQGSHRQKRGMLLKALSSKGSLTCREAAACVELDAALVKSILEELKSEQFLELSKGRYSLRK